MSEKRLSIGQLVKEVGAFAGAATVCVDGAMLFGRLTGLAVVEPVWYVAAPVGIVSAFSGTLAIHLAVRSVRRADVLPGQISGRLQRFGPGVRGVDLGGGGRVFGLLARNAVGPDGGESERYFPAVWRVPMDDQLVRVRESELRAFLEVCYKRRKFQFSRNYWTKQRRPPMNELRYNAIMRLLVEAGIVENRVRGASGRLVLFPQEAVMFLKYESGFKVG